MYCPYKTTLLRCEWQNRVRSDSLTHLPGNSEFLVDLSTAEKAGDVALNGGLELVIENDVFPVRFLDLQPQGVILYPPLLENENLFTKFGGPGSGGKQELAGWAFVFTLAEDKVLLLVAEALWPLRKDGHF